MSVLLILAPVSYAHTLNKIGKRPRFFFGLESKWTVGNLAILCRSSNVLNQLKNKFKSLPCAIIKVY